jgi:ligand-binding SRPBCC domain-containing protein
MRPGAIIDYRLSLFGVPFSWRTEIEAFEPETRFVDVQRRGPYRSWRHLHTFAEAPGGTLIGDRVEYQLPLGPLGELARVLAVRRQLDAIFDHRRRVIEATWGPPPAPDGPAHGSS